MKERHLSTFMLSVGGCFVRQGIREPDTLAGQNTRCDAVDRSYFNKKAGRFSQCQAKNDPQWRPPLGSFY